MKQTSSDRWKRESRHTMECISSIDATSCRLCTSAGCVSKEARQDFLCNESTSLWGVWLLKSAVLTFVLLILKGQECPSYFTAADIYCASAVVEPFSKGLSIFPGQKSRNHLCFWSFTLPKGCKNTSCRSWHSVLQVLHTYKEAFVHNWNLCPHFLVCYFIYFLWPQSFWWFKMCARLLHYSNVFLWHRWILSDNFSGDRDNKDSTVSSAGGLFQCDSVHFWFFFFL